MNLGGQIINPTCRSCGVKNKSIRLYECKQNLFKIPIKTNYCSKCAKCLGYIYFSETRSHDLPAVRSRQRTKVL